MKIWKVIISIVGLSVLLACGINYIVLNPAVSPQSIEDILATDSSIELIVKRSYIQLGRRRPMAEKWLRVSIPMEDVSSAAKHPNIAKQPLRFKSGYDDTFWLVANSDLLIHSTKVGPLNYKDPPLKVFDPSLGKDSKTSIAVPFDTGF